MSWLQTIGDNLVDSIISDNIPVLGEEAKFNELVTSSLKRIEVRKPSLLSASHLIVAAETQMPCHAGPPCRPRLDMQSTNRSHVLRQQRMQRTSSCIDVLSCHGRSEPFGGTWTHKFEIYTGCPCA